MLATTDFDSICHRISSLPPNAEAGWGKMTVSQMLAHCQRPLEVALGDRTVKPGILSFLFGKIAKRSILSNDVFKKNLPTAPDFVVRTTPDFEFEKQKLTSMIERFHCLDPASLEFRKHPFFGQMSTAEWRDISYKHLDHHLKQFGV